MSNNSEKEVELTMACRKGDIDKIIAVLKENVDVNAGSVQNEYLFSPLHYAAEQGNPEIARLLIENSADVNISKKNKSTPLHWVSGYRNGNYLEVAKLLIEKGTDINGKSEHNWTPLHCSVFGDYIETTKLLLGKGSDITIKNSDMKTPLELEEENNPDMLNLFNNLSQAKLKKKK